MWWVPYGFYVLPSFQCWYCGRRVSVFRCSDGLAQPPHGWAQLNGQWWCGCCTPTEVEP